MQNGFMKLLCFGILLGTCAGSLPSVVLSQELPKDLWTRKRGRDWPSFLGPRRDSKSTERGIRPWPVTGPRIVWTKPLGEGYGIGSVARGRFFQFDHINGQARLLCLNAETGEEIWTFTYQSNYRDMFGYDSGPRCSPVIDGDRVYLLGVEGQLHCLNINTGKVRWQLDTQKEFNVIQNFFGVGSTPLIYNDLLIAIIGGSPRDLQVGPGQLDRVVGNQSAVVAFDKMTGEVKYKLSDELAAYASPRIGRIHDRDLGFAFCRGGLVAFDPRAGKEIFHYPWRARSLESANASTPVVMGNQVLISETYGPGSALLNISADNQYQVLWEDSKRRDKAMEAHWNTPIYHDGYLYGCSGRNPPLTDLRCVEWKTGEVKWSVPRQPRSSLLYVDNHFIYLDEIGVLRLIKANPQRYELVSEVTAYADRLLREPCWAAPVLSHGLLYVRGRNRLMCLEVIPES